MTGRNADFLNLGSIKPKIISMWAYNNIPDVGIQEYFFLGHIITEIVNKIFQLKKSVASGTQLLPL